MITTGVIKEVNLSSEGYQSNIFMVEVPIFNTTADPESYTTVLECTVCLPGGIFDCYHINDLVYVGFINNKYNFPVILGKIYTGLEDISSGSYHPQQLNVESSSNLSKDTNIGDLKYSDLLRAVTSSDNQISINQFNTTWTSISSSIGNLYKGEIKQIGTWTNNQNLNRISYKWEGAVPADTDFDFEISLPDNFSNYWWDNSYSYIKEIGQPFFYNNNNYFNLEIDYSMKKGHIKGRVPTQITSIIATLLFA